MKMLSMKTPNTIFRQFVERHEPALPILPAVHITWGTNVSTIIDTNKLHLTWCKYYKKDLIYLFYGKPAYKLRRDASPTTRLLGDAAVCFVLNTNELPNMHRAFALDTGAAFGNRYNDNLPGKVSIDDFEMEAHCNSAAKLVSAFFGNNEKYVDGIVKSEIEISGLDVISDAYKAIATTVVSTEFDERACTCELQYAVEIELNKDSVRCIVMPHIMGGERWVQEKMSEWGVQPILYRFVLNQEKEQRLYLKNSSHIIKLMD